MAMQTADTIFMVRPAAFGFNTETADDNFFQQRLQLSAEHIHQKALEEFDNMVTVLSNHGINVIVAEDNTEPPSPDAVFPNNWICTNPDGIIS
ncbi:MAG: amidinotransferase, partial [Bacteroidetes bacterium]|nr:amidinotransferase [Bacteroidota bacterium]